MRGCVAESVLSVPGHVLARLRGSDRGGGVPGLHIERASEAGGRLVRS